MKNSYDQNIVLDLEFTPSRNELGLNLREEVIQIGAVRVDYRGMKIDSFCEYVRPQFATKISPHVQQLTGIAWQDVQDAAPFNEVMARFVEWIGNEAHTRIVAWSKSDRKQIEAECAAKVIDTPANMNCWLDLQQVFPRVMEIGRERNNMSLHTAVEWYGAELDHASEHTAIADAEHTADLLCMLLTGEYLEQKAAWASVMPNRTDSEREIAGTHTADCRIRGTIAPLGTMANQLAELYQAMCFAPEAAACA